MQNKIRGLGISVIAIAGGIGSLIALENNIMIVILVISFFVFIGGLAYLICTGRRIIPYIQRPKISLQEETKKSSEIWVAWHTGSAKLAEGDLFENKHKFRILLTMPKSSATKELGKVVNLSTDNIDSSIYEFTRKIKEKNHEIRWFDGFLGSSMIISDPEKESAWIRIETFVPHLAASFRPSIKFFKKYNESEFIRFKEIFDKLWNDSEKNQINI